MRKSKKNWIIELSYKNIIKKVNYNINLKIETLNIYLECNEYKMKYEGNNLFTLYSDFLLKNEIINFTIINNSIDPKLKNIILLQSLKNNNCTKPHKSEKENGFSLTIKSEDLDSILSFFINIYIGNRFKFSIKIYSKIKILIP